LDIDLDGSVRHISNANEKVEIYLKDAIQLFKKRNRHDNVQGDLNTAIGEANLLLGKLSGHNNIHFKM
jgi:bifunctional N-acetylglucosamine-1-phosphate-uridyltransferase/glucosamine-1-phosphate-acetyltransferase GlmU-like protein